MILTRSSLKNSGMPLEMGSQVQQRLETIVRMVVYLSINFIFHLSSLSKILRLDITLVYKMILPRFFNTKMHSSDKPITICLLGLPIAIYLQNASNMHSMKAIAMAEYLPWHLLILITLSASMIAWGIVRVMNSLKWWRSACKIVCVRAIQLRG